MAPLASQALILDAIFHDDMIIAVGDRGHILRSRDQGQSWEQSPVPVSIPLTAINKAAQDRLIVAGHDAVIMVSDDQGASWAIVHREPDWEQPILDLFFITPDRGLALGAYGLVLETTDGGASWAERTLFDGDSHLYASTRLPSGDLLIAGEFGTLLRSQDDGETWDELDSPYGGTFFGIATPTVSQPDEPLLVFGLQGNVFASNDNGDSWTPIATDIPNGLYDAVRTDDGRAVLLGHGGMILVDRDPSPGFDWASIIRPARKPLAGALPLEDGRFLIYGETGVEILRVEATP
ncbi:MAG: YCF48-related protein [Pseudomonadota bacterium]